MELALAVAGIAVAITLVSVAVDLLQTWHIRKVQSQLQKAQATWDERGDIGEQFGAFLMEREAPDKPSNLQIMATEVGQTLYASLRAGANAVLSGEKRHGNMVENRTLEALENSDPEMKVLKSIFERLGLEELWNPSDIPSVVNVLRKHGILGGNPNQLQGQRGSLP